MPFTYTAFDPAFDWTVMYWKVEPPTNPLAGNPFAKAFDTSPIRAEAAQRIELLASGPLGTGLPADWVVMRAETVATLAAGSYSSASRVTMACVCGSTTTRDQSLERP